ncbi:hypothetical protein [uncultured Psychromonas sp.]|uniref:hypothetical protein n=1 Tax=uncultured Psychromonas sp. TaxID=173974 RepID=UPI002610B3EB|nr:hypothetical protein [uncultured Psychromonas sp.]
MTHRCRDIRPTIALKDSHCVALYLSPAQQDITTKGPKRKKPCRQSLQGFSVLDAWR